MIINVRLLGITLPTPGDELSGHLSLSVSRPGLAPARGPEGAVSANLDATDIDGCRVIERGVGQVSLIDAEQVW